MELGVTLEAREAIAAACKKLERYLTGGIALSDSVSLSGGRSLSLDVSYHDGKISVKLTGEKPMVTAKKWILSTRAELEGFEIDEDKLTIVLNGLPDQTIKLK